MTLAGFKAQNHPQQTAKRAAVDAVDDRGTDQAFFDSLSERFGGFTLDVAAAEHNAKCADYYDIDDDGLAQPWESPRVWCNPPYSDCGAWVRKAWAEWHREPFRRTDLIVMLLPANRTEQAWWQDHVEPYRDLPGSPLRVEFLRGRMRFDRPGWTKPAKGDRPPFGCCLLIWGGDCVTDSDWFAAVVAEAERRGAEKALRDAAGEIDRRVRQALDEVRGGDLGTTLTAAVNAYSDACRDVFATDRHAAGEQR